MVRKLADDVNSIHKTGYGIDIPASGTGDSTTGLNFFVGSDSTEDSINADTIKLNPQLSDLNKIAAAESKQTAVAGTITVSNKSDNKIALKIMDLRTSPVYIFKGIVSSPITSSVTIPAAPNNTFSVVFGSKEYKVTMSGAPYADANAEAAALNTAIKAALPTELQDSIDVTTNTTSNTVSLKVNSKYADTNSISIDDPNNVFSAMGFPGNTKYDDYYAKVVEAIGQGGSEAKTISSGQQTLINQVDNKRKAMSGVSKDEEMTDMLKYQKAYNASARVVTAMDETLDVIVNRLKS
jgi:flagellar hook-associated protein 1 FlgK